MKILFLDIDGVCNNQESFKNPIMDPIDPVMAARVRKIIKETGCQVILSSSWRLHIDLRDKVRKEVCEFILTTPYMPAIRGEEIKRCLNSKPEFAKARYAILDDSSDFLPDQPLFKTEWTVGLTNEIMQQVIDYLNAKA